MTINDPSIFRNNDKLGDRALAGFFGEQSIVLTTYHYNIVEGSQRDIPKFVKLTSEEEKSWIFIYMYYTQANSTVQAYLKIGDREEFLDWGVVSHFIPHYFAAYVGVDPYYAPCNINFYNFFWGKRGTGTM